MGKPLVLCCHLPRIRPMERHPVALALSALVDYPDEWDFSLAEIKDAHGYAVALANFWDHDGDLVNIEHDIAATPGHVRALLACPHPLCAWTYPIAPATSGRYSVIPSVTDPDYTLAALFARRPAPGLCKLSDLVRREMPPPVATLHYKEVEGALWRAAPVPWHLHQPYVAHYHGFPEGYYAHWRQNQPEEAAGLPAGAPGGTQSGYGGLAQ